MHCGLLKLPEVKRRNEARPATCPYYIQVEYFPALGEGSKANAGQPCVKEKSS